MIINKQLKSINEFKYFYLSDNPGDDLWNLLNGDIIYG